MESLERYVTDKYVCLMLLVFPLWTGLDGYARITRAKFAFFTAATCLWAAALLCAAVRRRTLPRPPRCAALAAAAFSAWAALSALLSPYWPGTALGWNYDGLFTALLCAFCALGVATYGVMHERYVNLLAISVSLCCALALLQLARLNPLGLYPEGYDYYGGGVEYNGRFLGTLGNVNLLGAFLSLSCPALAWAALDGRGRRLWLLLPAAAGCALCALARCEGALLGMGAAALFGILYYVKSSKPRLLPSALALAAAALVSALACAYLFPPEGGTLWELSELLHGRVEDGFGSGRAAIWREALRLWSERPLLGQGPGGFGFASQLEFERAAENGALLVTRAEDAHSLPLAALAELGLPGLFAALAPWAMAFARWLRGTHPALGLALSAYFVQALTGIGGCFVLPLACIFLGFMLAKPVDSNSLE